jgi:DNA-directed RNA polymerase specialized sigma24 family protein
LKLDLIDGDLYPTANKTQNRELTKASDEVVRAGLRRVLGNERFMAYDAMKTPDRRKRVMVHALEEHLTAATPYETPQERETRVDLTNILDKLSPELRKVVDEELDELDEVPF